MKVGGAARTHPGTGPGTGPETGHRVEGVNLMLSVSKPMTAGGASTYFGREDYYLAEPGEWQGKGAEALGLTGDVNREQFMAVACGMDPRTGEVLIESKSGKNNRLEHRAGQDFTFSAPKSVSLLAVGNSEHKKMHDTAVARVLEHMEKNYSYARQTTDKVTKPVETGNLVIAKFGHFVSRELDPQLHTHAFFVNMTERQAGEWRATHNDMLNKDVKALGRLYRNELAHIYKDAGYEIEITDREKSFWEVKGVSKELIDDASKRSEQIDQRFSELRQMPEYAAWSETDIRQKATLDTRKAKDPNLDKAELRGMWERDFAARGETIEGVVEKVEALRQQNLSHEKTQIEAGIVGPDRPTAADTLSQSTDVLHSQESAFGRAQALDIACKMEFGQHSLSDLTKAFDNHADFVALGSKKLDRSGNSREMFTTTGMQRIEASIIERVKEGKGQFKPVATRDEVSAYLGRREAEKTAQWRSEGKLGPDGEYKFTAGQREYVVKAICGGDNVLIAQGDPGVGKTTSRELIKGFNDEILAPFGRAQHYTVGVAFTGKAAAEIADRGVEASTIDSFLNREIRAVDVGSDGNIPASKKSSEILVPKGANLELLIDEASMTSSQHINLIMNRAQEWREQLGVSIKITKSGDTKQMTAIGAGKEFAEIQRLTGTDKVELTDIVRQKSGSYAHQVATVMNTKLEDRTDHALDTLASAGRVHTNSDREKLMAAAVTRFREWNDKNESGFIVTALNADRKELNSKIRDQLVETGKIEKGEEHRILTAGGITGTKMIAADNLKVGQVAFYSGTRDERGKTIKDDGSGIRPGSKGEITAIDREKNTVTVQYGEGEKSFAENHDLRDDWNKINVYDRETRSFSKGDDVVFLKNDKALKVMNGDRGKIENIDGDKCTIKKDDGSAVIFRLSEASKAQGGLKNYCYIDHGYAVTTEKSQGATVKNTAYFAFVEPNGLSNTRSDMEAALGTKMTHETYDKFNTSLSDNEAGWSKSTDIKGHKAVVSVDVANIGGHGKNEELSKVAKIDFADGFAVVKDAEVRREMREAGMWFNKESGAWMTGISNPKAAELLGNVHPLKEEGYKKMALERLADIEKRIDQAKSIEPAEARELGEKARQYSKSAYNSANVAFTRGTDHIDLFTNNLERFRQQIRVEKDKESTHNAYEKSDKTQAHNERAAASRAKQVESREETKEHQKEMARETEKMQAASPNLKKSDVEKSSQKGLTGAEKVNGGADKAERSAGEIFREGINFRGVRTNGFLSMTEKGQSYGDKRNAFGFGLHRNERDGAISTSSTSVSRSLGGSRVTRRMETVRSGENKGLQIKTRTERDGSIYRQTQEFKRKDGTKVKVESKGAGYRVAGLELYSEKYSREKVKSGPDKGSEKITKSRTILNHVSGTTVTKHSDGRVTKTKWSGYFKKDFFTGKKELVIEKSETKTYVKKSVGQKIFETIVKAKNAADKARAEAAKSKSATRPGHASKPEKTNVVFRVADKIVEKIDKVVEAKPGQLDKQVAAQQQPQKRSEKNQQATSAAVSVIRDGLQKLAKQIQRKPQNQMSQNENVQKSVDRHVDGKNKIKSKKNEKCLDGR